MKKLLVLLSFISLSFCGFLFAGCDPYSNMKINLSDTTVVLSRSTDVDADTKTISATVKGAKGDISDEVVFISSKPEVVEVVKTTYADGTTRAELKAMGAGDAVVYAIAEGNVKKSINVKVEQNATGVGFTSNLSPVITRGEDFRFSDSYVSFQPANTTDKTYNLTLLSQDGETVVYDMASSNYIPANVTDRLTESLYKLKLTKTVGEKTFSDMVSVNVLAKIDENKITIEQETENGWVNINLAGSLALSTNTELNETKIRVKYNGNLISSIYTLDVSSTASNIELYPSGASEYVVKGFSQGLGKIVAKLSYAGFESFYSKSVELATDVKIYPESIKLNGVNTTVGLFSDNIFYNQNTKFVFTVSPAETSYKKLALKVLTSDLGSKIQILKQDGNVFVKEEGNETYNYLTAKEGFSYSDANNEYTYIVFNSSAPIYVKALSTGGTVQAEVFNNDISSISVDVLLTIRRPVTGISFFTDSELTEKLSKVNLSQSQTRTIYFAYEPSNAYFESLNFIADEQDIISITKGSEVISGTTYYKLILTALNVGKTTVKAYNGNNLIENSSFDAQVFIPLEENGEDHVVFLSTQTPEQNPLITAVDYSVNTGSVSDIKVNNSNSTYDNPLEFYVAPQPANATVNLSAEFELNGVVLEQTENEDGSIEVYKDLNGSPVCYFIYQKDTTNNTYKVFVQANAYGNSFVIRFIISGFSAGGEEIGVTRSVNATIYNQVDYNNIHVLKNGTAKITSLALKSSSTVGADNLSEATSQLKLQIDKVVEGVNDYTIDVRLSGGAVESSLNYAKVLSNGFVSVLQTGKGEYSVIAGDLGSYSQMRNVLTFEVTEDGKTFYYPVEIWVTNNTLTSEINVLNATKADDGANSFIRSYEVGTTFALQTLVQPSNADNKALEFASSDESVFSVDANGVITFTGFGSANLYVLAKDSAHVTAENYFNYIAGLISRDEFESLINYEVYSVVDVRVENGLDTAYSIYNASDINLLYKAENKYSKFLVQSDITLSGSFGTIESFAGEFDGNNKTISNLTSPLFGLIEVGGRVVNVKVANSKITSSDASEIGFIARVNNGTIAGCEVDAIFNMASFNGSLGGVVGVNRGEVNFNTVTIRMAGNASIAGGVVGENYGVVLQNAVYFYGIADQTSEMAFAVKGNIAGGVVGLNETEDGIYNSVSSNMIYSYVDDNFVSGTTLGVVAGQNNGGIISENTLYNFTGTTSLDKTGASVVKITEKDEIKLTVKPNAVESNGYIAIYSNELFASVVAGEYKFSLDTWLNEIKIVDEVEIAINLSEKYEVYGLSEITYLTYKVFNFTVYCKKNPAEQATFTTIIATEVEYFLYDASTGEAIDLNNVNSLTIRKGASKEFYVEGEAITFEVSSTSVNFEIVNLGGSRYKVTHLSGNEGVINFIISRTFNINDNVAKITLASKNIALYAVSGIVKASFDAGEINFSKQDIAVVTLSVVTDGEAPSENTIYTSIVNQIVDKLGEAYTEGIRLDVIVKQTSSQIISEVTDANSNVLTTFTKYYYTIQLFFNNSESLIKVNYANLQLDLQLLFNGFNDLGEAIELVPSLKVNILPQEVDNVQFAYYSSNQLNGQLITTQAPQNIIVAGGSGLLEVYSYPYYADYDYAVITSSSATTDDGLSFYLNFEQRFEKGNKYETAFSSGLYQSQDDYLRVNNVPYGTYLDKVTTYNSGVRGFNGFYYIWIVFDNIKANNLKDGTSFKINLSFYKQNGDLKDYLTDEVVGDSYEFTLIYSRMPSAEVELKDGGDVIVAGVDAELVITKGKPTDRDPILSVAFASRGNNGTLSLVQKDGKYFIKTGIDLMQNNSSVSIILYITTQKVLGGIVETLTTEKEFTVVKFKVLSIDFAENNLRKPTYEAINLSYKITAKYFTVPNGYVATSVQQNYIDGIRAEITELEKRLTYSNYTNNVEGESYVNSRYVTFTNYADYQDKLGFILSENKMAVYALKEVSEQITLNAQITVTYDSGSAIPKFVEPGATNNRVESSLDQTFSANLVFTFYVDTSEENPTPINTLDDFLNILSKAGEDTITEGHFRLNTNIYLTGWQADRSLNVESFDGNGYVIYINNFNTTSSNSEILNLALFNEIGSNTLVKNLIVCMPKGQITLDVYDNLNLQTLNFAGIAVTNNGSIYNSEVLSLNINAFNQGTEDGVTYHNYFAGASRPDTFRLEDYPYETHRVVETENADGSVTRTPATTTVVINSRASVDLNVGLFVTNNNGNILNSRVGRSLTSVYGTSDITLAKGATISSNIGYQYMRDKFSNVSASKQVLDLSSYVANGNGIQIVANGSVAGFVNENDNDGLISNSYVANLAITNNHTTVSSAQTAGFVAVNYGTIMYSSTEGVASFTNDGVAVVQDVQSVGSQIQGSGNIAGFVFENIGDISNSISNVRINTNAISAGFVYSNTGGGTVSQCLSFSKNNTSAVNSPFAGHTGLQTLQNGVVENSFYYDELQTLTSISEDDSATPFSNDIESSKAENYAGFAINDLDSETSLRDVSYVWALKTLFYNGVEDRDVKYPVIVSAHQIAVTHYELKLGNSGDNSGKNFYIETSGQNSPVLISSEAEWNTRLVNNNHNATSVITGNFRLIDNVDFSENAIVRTSSYYFAGNLDGNGLSLNNFALEGGGDFDGLFKGIVSVASFGTYLGENQLAENSPFTDIKNPRNAVVKNITLAPQRVKSNAASAGVLAGVIYDANIYDITISSQNIKDDTTATTDPSILTAWFYAGGLSGVIWGDSVINNITSDVGVMATSYLQETNKSSYYGDVNMPLPNLKLYVNNSQEGGAYVVSKFNNHTFLATEEVAKLVPHYAGGIAAVVNIFTADDLSLTPSDDEEVKKPNVERVSVNANSAFVSMAIHAGGVFGYVGQHTFVRDALFTTQNVNGARISGYRVLGGIAGVNMGTLQFARLVFAEFGDTSQLELDEDLFNNPYTYNADFHLFEISTTTDSSYATIYVGGVAGINIGRYENEEFTAGSIIDSYSKVPIRPVFNQGTNGGYTFSYGQKVVIAGGLVGQMYGGTIRNAYVTGQVVANYSGGVIGVIPVDAKGVSTRVKLENINGMTNYVDKGWSTDIADTNANTYPNATRTTEYLTTSFANRSTYRPGGIVSAFIYNNITNNQIYVATAYSLDGKTDYEGTVNNYTVAGNSSIGASVEIKEVNYNSLIKSNSFGNIIVPFVYSESVSSADTIEVSEILNGLEDYFAVFNETDDGTWEYTGFSEAKMLPYPTYGLVSTVSYIYDELTFYDIRDYAKKSYYIDPTLSRDWQKMYGSTGITKDNYFIEVNITEEDANGNIISQAGWTPFHDGDFIGQLIGTRKIVTLANGEKETIYPTVKIKLSTSFANNLALGIFDTLKGATVRNLNFQIILEESTQPTNEITGKTAFGFLAAYAIDSKISNVTITWANQITSYSEGGFKNYQSPVLSTEDEADVRRLSVSGDTVIQTNAPAKLNVNYFGGLVGFEQGCEIENTSVNYNGNTVTLYEPWSMLPVAGTASVAVSEEDPDDTIQYAGGLVGKSMDFPDRNARSEYTDVRVSMPRITINDYVSDTISINTTKNIYLTDLYIAGLVGHMNYTKEEDVQGLPAKVNGFSVFSANLTSDWVSLASGSNDRHASNKMVMAGAFGYVDATISGTQNGSYELPGLANVYNLQITSHSNETYTDGIYIAGFAGQVGDDEESSASVSNVNVTFNTGNANYAKEVSGFICTSYADVSNINVTFGRVDGSERFTSFSISHESTYDVAGTFIYNYGVVKGAVVSMAYDTEINNKVFNNALIHTSAFAVYNYGEIHGASASLAVDNPTSTKAERTVGENTIKFENGSFVAYNGGTISYSDVALQDLINPGVQTGYWGGFVGYNEGNINNCYANNDNLYVSSYGGFVFDMAGGEIRECYSFGVINSVASVYNYNSNVEERKYNYVGGFVANATYGSITDCYSNVEIAGRNSGSAYIGGFASRIYNTNVTNCYSVSTIKTTQGYDSSAGYIGLFAGDVTYLNKVANCYVVDEFGMHQPIIGRGATDDSDAVKTAITRDYLGRYLDGNVQFGNETSNTTEYKFTSLLDQDGQERGAWLFGAGAPTTDTSDLGYHFPLLKAGSLNYEYSEESGMYGVIAGTDNIEIAGQAYGSRVNPCRYGYTYKNTQEAIPTYNANLNYYLGRKDVGDISATGTKGYIVQVHGVDPNPNGLYGVNVDGQSTNPIGMEISISYPTPQAILTGIHVSKLSLTGEASGVYTNIYLNQNTSMFTGTAQNVVLENVLYGLSAISSASGLIANNVSSSSQSGATPNYFNNVNTKGTATARGGLINNLSLNISTYFFKCSNGVNITTQDTLNKAGFINYVNAAANDCTLKFEQCFNTGNITTATSGSGANIAGGLIGRFNNTTSGGSGNHLYAYDLVIDNCFNAANFTINVNSVHTGGLIGYIEAPKTGGSITISNSMSGGFISAPYANAYSWMGGLIGVVHKYDSTAAYGEHIKIENCLALMDVWADYNNSLARIGTICGVIHDTNNGVTITNCYYAEDLMTGEIDLYRGTATTTEALSTTFSFSDNNPTLAGITATNGFKFDYANSVFPYLAFVDELPNATGNDRYINYDIRGTYLFPNAFEGSKYLTSNYTSDYRNEVFKSNQVTAIKTAYGTSSSRASNKSISKSNVTVLGLGKTNYISDALFSSFSGRMYSVNVNVQYTITANKSSTVGGMIDSTSGTTCINNCSVSGEINAKTDMGAFIGTSSYASTIRMSTNSAHITQTFDDGASATQWGTGGFIGTSSYATTIRMSTNSAHITQTFDDGASATQWGTGGFIGYITTGNKNYNIIKCINRGSISSQKSAAGGFLGGGWYQSGSTSPNLNIYESVNQGAITGVQAGGLIGYSPFKINISDCYNVGTITASSYAGGLIGNAGSLATDYAKQSSGTVHINIAHSYNASIINGSGKRAGIIGWMLYNTASVTNSYWISDTALNTVAAATSNGGVASGDNLKKVVNCWHWNPTDSTWHYWISYAKTMDSIFTYSNWSSTSTYNPWVYNSSTYGTQANALASLKVNTTNKWVLWGNDGTTLPTLKMQYQNVDESYYLVYNEESLEQFSLSYSQTASATTHSKETALQMGVFKSMDSIGMATDSFTGVDWKYDGNNYFIVNSGTNGKTGAFDRIMGTVVEIKNLGVVSIVGNGNKTATNYGGIIGSTSVTDSPVQLAARGETKPSLKFDNCWVSIGGIAHTGTNSFGGFIGLHNGSVGVTYENCKTYGSVNSTATYIGGITGQSDAATTFISCINNATITGNSTLTDLSNTVGGLVGNAGDNTPISYCENNASITSNTGVAGGLIGENTCMINTNGIWSNNINKGAVSGVLAGGIAGQLRANVHANASSICTITGLENTGTITALHSNVKECLAGGIIGYSTGSYIMQSSTNSGRVTSGAMASGGTAKSKHVGGLIGLHVGYTSSNTKLTLDTCRNAGAVVVNSSETAYSNAGGLISHIVSADVEIFDCDNTGEIHGQHFTAGGFVGYAQHSYYSYDNSSATIRHTLKITSKAVDGNYYASQINAKIHANTADGMVGGVIGNNELNVIIDDDGNYTTNPSVAGAFPILIKSFNNADDVGIYGGKKVGGIIGQIDGGTVQINGYDSNTTDNVTSLPSFTLSRTADGKDNYIGGIVGDISDSASSLQVKYIQNNASTASGYTNYSSYYGGFIGRTTGSVTLENCINNGAVAVTYNTSIIGTYDNDSFTYNCIGGFIGLIGTLTYEGSCTRSAAACSITIDNCRNKQSIGSVSGDGYVGGFVGYSITSGNTSLRDLTNESTATINGIQCGGIYGAYISDTTAGLECQDVINNAPITMRNSSKGLTAGGLFGDVTNSTSSTGSAVFRDCENNGQVVGIYRTESRVGGLLANCELSATLENCRNKKSVSTAVWVGGLIGRSTKDITFKSCTNGASDTTATISGGQHCGGFIGYAAGGTVNIGESGSTSYNTNYMSVSATTDAGGFIGNSYANVNIYGIARNGVSTSTTARIMTLGSTEDANAGGFIGYNAGTLKIGMTANGNWEYLSSYAWNEWHDPSYWGYSATNYMNVIGYKCGGFVGNNNGAFNSYVIQNCGKIGTPELDYTSYVQMSLRSANVTASSTAQAKEFMVSGAGSWRRLTYSNGAWSVTTPSTQLPVVNAPTTYAFKVKGTTNTYFFKYGFININTSNKTVSACNDYGYGFVHSAGGFVGYSLNDVKIKGFSFDEYYGATSPDECSYQTDANSVNRGYVGALNWNFGESYAAGFIGYTLSTSTIRFASNNGSIGLTGTRAVYDKIGFYTPSSISGWQSMKYRCDLLNIGGSYFYINGTSVYEANSYNFDHGYIPGSNARCYGEFDSCLSYSEEYAYYGGVSKESIYKFDIFDGYGFRSYSRYWHRLYTNSIGYGMTYPGSVNFSSYTPTKSSPFVGHSTATQTLFCTANSKGVLGQSVTHEGGTSTSYADYLCGLFI